MTYQSDLSLIPVKLGALCCTIAMAVLGGSVGLSALLVAYPTLTGQALRYAVAAAGLAMLTRLGGTAGTWPTRAELARLAALAATGLAWFNYCLLVAVRHGDGAIVGTVVGFTPLVLAVLGPALRGQRPGGRLLAAAGVVVAGAALVYGGGHTDAIGLAAAVGTLAGEVAFSMLAAPLLGRLGPMRVSTWSCALAVPLLGVAALLAGEPARWRLPTAAEGWVLVYLGVVVTVLAFPVWYAGVHRLGVERAGLFAALLPVTALVAASIVERQVPGTVQVAGVCLVATGLATGLGARSRDQSPARSAERTASA
jgi:drug/metabolite transporter (DMT)-like permease